VAGGEGECGDDVAGWLVRERRSLDISPVKKKAKLSASEVPGEVVGSYTCCYTVVLLSNSAFLIFAVLVV